MKTAFKSLIVIIIAFAAIFTTIYITQFKEEILRESDGYIGPALKFVEDDASNKSVYNKPMIFFTSYSGSVKSIEELKLKSTAIVLATVVKQEKYSDFAVKTTLAVSKTIKGKHQDKIYVFELGALNGPPFVAGQQLLSKDTKYMLFLVNRWPDKPEIKDEFFIMVGFQGILIVDGNTIHAVDKTLDKDLQSMLISYNKPKAVELFIEKMSEPESLKNKVIIGTVLFLIVVAISLYPIYSPIISNRVGKAN